MESLIPLLLMLVLYLVPELLKRRKDPKKYEYPDIPDKVPQPVDMKPAEIKIKPIPQPAVDFSLEIPKTWVIPAKPAVAMPAPVSVPLTIERPSSSVSPWTGKLSPQLVQNGLIFSEILQPPRAYRPIGKHPR